MLTGEHYQQINDIVPFLAVAGEADGDWLFIPARCKKQATADSCNNQKSKSASEKQEILN